MKTYNKVFKELKKYKDVYLSEIKNTKNNVKFFEIQINDKNQINLFNKFINENNIKFIKNELYKHVLKGFIYIN